MFLDFATVAIVAAAVCTTIAVVISVRHIRNHLDHYEAPRFQRHIVRILVMVPIYSLTAWLALVITSKRAVLILNLIRDSYEAYVIYNFVVLLINYGGGHLRLCRYLEGQPRMDHSFPFGLYFPPFKPGPAFLGYVRAAVLQFVFVKPLNSALTLYLHEHHTSTSNTIYSVIPLFIVILDNLSVSAALYGLVLFYHAAEPLLRPYQPFEKFIAVKAVIFFSFWQGLGLDVLKGLGFLHDMRGFSADEQASGIQDVLICAEMALAAIAHLFVFSWTEYASLGPAPTNKGHAACSNVPSSVIGQRNNNVADHPLLQVVDFRDVLSDAKDRFYGGIGFENELVDGAPIIPGRVLPETDALA